MFFSEDQLRRSLERLSTLHPFFGMTFLAFKKVHLPVGIVHPVNFSKVVNDLLVAHYRPVEMHDGFYNPFKTTTRWVSERYASTSQQRIAADTFADALLHEKGTSKWGWTTDYIGKLQRHLGSERIPAFDLAVWLYRHEKWQKKDGSRNVIERFLRDYDISETEQQELFDIVSPGSTTGWLVLPPLTETKFLNLIGKPPGAEPEEGAALRLLDTTAIGPSHRLKYEPADRLNIITGDNSLGKTFLLDTIWWALTGSWHEYPPLPRGDVPKTEPRILFEISKVGGKIQQGLGKFDWDRQVWRRSPKPAERSVLPGLVIYARFDGSFAVWDPSRVQLADDDPYFPESKEEVFLELGDVWNGLQSKDPGNPDRTLCNGLVRDWVTWQVGGLRYGSRYDAFKASLWELSPSDDEILEPGDPIRFPLDAREMPTLKMPYGEVPICLAAAGVRRVVALAYVLVWAWHEHLENCKIVRRQPQRRLVLLVDEVEAHLHPRWQRVIVPAIMRVVQGLSADVTPQLHLATHSPLVLASAEAVVDGERDSLFHLDLERGSVLLKKLAFHRYGRVDAWLTSDIFGLMQPRSLQAERAIKNAMQLQLADEPDASDVSRVHLELNRYLADDDEFWPRWRYFAESHGAGR